MRIKSPAIINKWVEPTSADYSLSHKIDFIEENCDAQNVAVLEKKEINETSALLDEKIEESPVANKNIICDALEDDKISNKSIEELPLSNENIHTENKYKNKLSSKYWLNSAILPNIYKRTRHAASSNGNSSENSAPDLESKEKQDIDTSTPHRSRIDEFYALLRINREHYNYMVNRSMEAKKILKNAKDKLRSNSRANAVDEESEEIMDKMAENADPADTAHTQSICENEFKKEMTDSLPVPSDVVDMDISTDEYSHFTQSNENLSGDDSFNPSPMQSITEGEAPTYTPAQLNVGRKLGIGEIGRSTSDNPRLRNKYLLGDIGRSFSEHQDDEAIVIGERNISAPTSSIAIQNKPNSGFFERRAYSVSPTHRGLRRGMLSRDQSLSDSSKQRYSLTRDGSIQSDSSHCSSVESLLDARKPDPEAILRQLGFGPANQEDILSRIPQRYVLKS